MLKAIILDFDGLIVDTEVVWYQIYVEWFKKHKDYDMTVEEFLTCVGSNAEDLFRKLDAQGIHVDREAFVRDTQQRFIEQSGTLPAKDGVADFIHAARERGVKVALATSSGRRKPETHLRRLGLLDQFDLLVTAEDVTRIKPFPDLFLAAAEKLGLAPEECLVVEDSLNGLKAGQNAGMRVLVVPNDVTKYCTFEGDLRLCESLAQVDFDALMADF
ncbi:HAD family hydrolase [Agathobaculum sp.]|uniref:HAD family hydrolase n=1 Tax=Agathobaculum sp. TaxID=2048138 RepID=UPI002A83C04E|nr:HAD family hydrolase [Agathobaculum sp.]MDY3618398.1 HAD family hydrolase [Agathobaculum sp.]